MTDRPIIFSAPMVRALLDGRKTQTRRIIKPTPEYGGGGRARDPQNWSDPDAWGWENYNTGGWDLLSDGYTGRHYYAPGDRLWVREAWRTDRAYDDLPPSDLSGEEPLIYLADDEVQRWGWKPDVLSRWGRYRHARFMPQWASRLTLTVTDVRVQRLQEISEADARAEGARGDACGPWGCEGLIEDFSDLWNRIHGDDAWDTNPWIVALTFTVARGNIDGAEQ